MKIIGKNIPKIEQKKRRKHWRHSEMLISITNTCRCYSFNQVYQVCQYFHLNGCKNIAACGDDIILIWNTILNFISN